MAITSNSPVEITRDYFRTTGIPADIFCTIVGAGDTDHPKPAPALYQETCRRPETRPIAHRSFPTLADPELWGVVGLTAALDTATVPRQ